MSIRFQLMGNIDEIWTKEKWDNYPIEDKSVINTIIDIFAKENLTCNDVDDVFSLIYKEINRRMKVFTNEISISPTADAIISILAKENLIYSDVFGALTIIQTELQRRRYAVTKELPISAFVDR